MNTTRALNIAALPGDGIGPEVMQQGLAVLHLLARQAGIATNIQQAHVGGTAYDQTADPLPEDTLQLASQADAVLLGAVGGPKWDTLPPEKKPESGLLRLRASLQLFANLRPAQVHRQLVHASSLKPTLVQDCDIMVVRELTGGIYFGQPRGRTNDIPGQREAFNTMRYHEKEITRIMRTAFQTAQVRRQRLCSVDKANVLEVSMLWREIACEIAKEFPSVALEHMYVDNAVMQLVREPKHFDTMVTGNLFGDILSDTAAVLTGSIGMLPSASLGEKHALYEPVHGSAPDIAGQDSANPLAMMLSIGMLFRYTLRLPQYDDRLRQAITEVLTNYRTPDIYQVMDDAPTTEASPLQKVGCQQMGELVLQQLEKLNK